MKIIRNKYLLVLLLLAGSCTLCSAKFKSEQSAYPLNFLDRQLTLILINDNFSPPVASRVYAYTSISAYTVLAESAGKANALRKVIIDYPAFDMDKNASKDFSSSVASAYTFYYLSKKLIYTFDPFDDSFKVLLNWYRQEGCTDAQIENSRKIAKDYSDKFIAWVGKDNFAETRRMPEYVLDDKPGHWVPTYPGYIPALEPHWNVIRRLIADTSEMNLDKFVPVPYDTSEHSRLFAEAETLFNQSKNATKEQLWMADFWDCNAFAIFPVGHQDNIIKKMSPGGHWMNIISITSRQSGADIYKTGLAYALTATGLFEGFICAWKLKYKYCVARPETYLQNPQNDLHKLGYPDFSPYLQSPPFPEYPSAHSIISMSSAVILTDIFGPSFYFTDNTEVPWGIAERSFPSFIDAAKEAAISRFYGLIHYKYACLDGSDIGAEVGNAILHRVKK